LIDPIKDDTPFIKGEESQAQVYLDKAFNFADNHQDLLAELWFYRLAH
jgi:hypothetical protein